MSRAWAASPDNVVVDRRFVLVTAGANKKPARIAPGGFEYLRCELARAKASAS
jgi:hypothetical protein